MKRGRRPRWLLLLCVLAGGCDYLWNIDHVGPGDGSVQPFDADVAGDALGPGCGTPLIFDKFNTGTVCAPWGESYLDLEAQMVQNGKLVITPGHQANSIGGCIALAQHPFGTGIAARVTETLRGESTYTVLSVHGPNVQIKGGGDGTLRFQTLSSVDLGTPVSYDPVTTVWWRIRPEGIMSVIGEYSSDGMNWTLLGTLAMAAPMMVTLEISAGTNTTNVSGSGAFDELLICND